MNSHQDSSDKSAYWQERAEQNADKEFRYSNHKAQLVTRWFTRTAREMEQRVHAFYRDYAVKEQLTLSVAKQSLNNRRALNLSLKEAERLSQLYPQDKELRRLLDQSFTSRAISREEFLQMQLNLLTSELYGSYANELHQTLTGLFEESYYKGLFDCQQFIGFGRNFNRISTHQIEAAVTTAWKGKNYSQRLWGDHRVSLARYLNRIVTNGFNQGNSSSEMRAQLQKAMSMSAFHARRLIRTESCQVSNRANLLSYQEFGTKKYEFLATLDYKTSALCRSMDGKVFLIEKAVPGETMPPLHPFCRSTTVPSIEDSIFDADTRAARDADGTTYTVPADMHYLEWHKRYVESSPKELMAERKLKNGAADLKQFRSYSTLMSKDAPKNLDDFQNIKYTDGSAWDDFKQFARYKRTYPHSNQTYYEINKEIQLLREQGLVDKSIGIAVAPQCCKIEDYGIHALQRMFERSFGTEDAQHYIDSALVEFRQFKGTRSAFYARNGVAVLLHSNNTMVTGWNTVEMDEKTDKVMEVLKKYGK